MVKNLEGFQCEKCKSVYFSLDEAIKCENKPMEKPLIKVGHLLIDDSYDVEDEIRLGSIYYEKHEVCYIFEWIHPDGEWEYLYTIYGNNMLSRGWNRQLSHLLRNINDEDRSYLLESRGES